METACNIAARLPQLARENPDQIAIRCPGQTGTDGMARYDVALSYRQLDGRSDAIAAGFSAYGIGRGVRAVVMVRPSPEFFLLMFALFKVGAVPVLVDPGIDRRALKQCLDEAQPQAFIGIPLAHLARRLLGWSRSATRLVTVGRRWGWGGTTLARIEAEWRRRRQPVGRYRAGRYRRHPVHQRLHRRAQGRGLPPPSLHRPDRTAAHRLRHRSPAAWTCRRSRHSRCSIRHSA